MKDAPSQPDPATARCCRDRTPEAEQACGASPGGLAAGTIDLAAGPDAISPSALGIAGKPSPLCPACRLPMTSCSHAFCPNAGEREGHGFGRDPDAEATTGDPS